MDADAAISQPMSREQFSAFYNQTAPALRRYLARIAGNADVADDLLQEAFIRLISTAPAEDGYRRAYLYRTATNLVLDHFRALRRERVGLGFWRSSQPTSAKPEDLATDVEGAFAQLSVRERALLWLAHVEGATHAEIADAIGVQEKSVRVLLFRARGRMERLLQEHNVNSGEKR